MDKTIIFATGNEGKMKEIRMILSDLGYRIMSMKEAGIFVEVEENGTTFEENAIIKAKAIAQRTKAIVLADDSGLEVDYMQKAPGILSARFMGEETSYHIKNQYIIDQLNDAKGAERSARFVCAIASVLPDGQVFTTRGTIEGMIGYEEKGANGFGYDPIFYLPTYDCSTAELSPDLKNKISHRGKALAEMKLVLQKYLQ